MSIMKNIAYKYRIWEINAFSLYIYMIKYFLSSHTSGNIN